MSKIINVIQQSQQWEPKLVALRRQLHQIPEISPHLSQTKSLIINALADFPLKRRKVKHHHSLCFDLKGRKKGPTIILCASMDGSSLKEHANHQFCSQILGQSHALAHDFQMSCLVNTLQLLSQYKDHISGTVRAIFLAGEQDHSGAIDIIQSHLLEHAELAFSLDFDHHIESGIVEYQYGISKPRVDEITLEYIDRNQQEKTCYYQNNPVDMATQLTHEIPQLLRQEFGALTPLSLNFTQLNAGEANNFQPSFIRINGRLYSFSHDNATNAIQFLQQVMKHRFNDDETNVIATRLCPPLENNTTWLNYVLSTLNQIKTSNQVQEQIRPRLIGDGFAHFNLVLPCVKLNIGCMDSNHQNRVCEKALVDGMMILSNMISKHLMVDSDNIILGKF
ncbi:MAG: hypothetical protein CMF42_04695 [Legionellales bacterium]|nr:hypothetical protein [Legionellales bacterium]OUX67317.1 MAG: hypothetical protein CBD38_02885 [bacterium TMED178]